MSKLEGLRAGAVEMRSVAARLLSWADDLEASFQNKKTAEDEVENAGTAGDQKGKSRSKGKSEPVNPEQVCMEQCGDNKEEKKFTLPEVRAILAEKCAAGYGTQVKALIESFGVSSLGSVPAESYAELVSAANGLGGETDAG